MGCSHFLSGLRRDRRRLLLPGYLLKPECVELTTRDDRTFFLDELLNLIKGQ